MMTLEEAIKHCKDVALSCTNKECALEHLQLLKWLQEYSNMLEKQCEQKSIDNLSPQEAMDIAVAKCFEQGEQKPVDKAEPKFKVGDWLVHDMSDGRVTPPVQIIEMTNKSYVLDDRGCFYFFDAEEIYRKWTIQDAKDGDVLVDRYENIGIFEKTFGLDWHSYCYLGCNGDFMYGEIGGSHDLVDSYPATKEQCDLLFQKMKDAGYEWDADKKELKKVEQTPVIEMTSLCRRTDDETFQSRRQGTA